MPLTKLEVVSTNVSDLSPLQEMPLTVFNCWENPQLSDASPLKSLPLKELSCDSNLYQDAQNIRAIKTLEKINDKPAADFWKEAEDQKSP
jgi:hypothetical protein